MSCSWPDGPRTCLTPARRKVSAQRRKREVIHQGRVVLFDHTVVLADGTEANYEVDESIPFAVATLVVDGDAVFLTRQYRYPIGRWIYDLPAGAGEGDETPQAAALRELEEETGLVANDLRPLHVFYMNPGRSAWPVHVFVCTMGTTKGQADRSDPTEQVRLLRMPVRELDARIASGEIVDPPVIVARSAAAVQGILPDLRPPSLPSDGD
jgi:8-oxo-dGTP pyrophosphatase MutT (NUDIX family)